MISTTSSSKVWFTLALALALSMSLPARAAEWNPGQSHAGPRHRIAARATPAAHDVPDSNGQLTRFTTEFDGDRSLDAATVAEQGFNRFALYTVHLQFASGKEQSISITAPSGGLQPEMLDMTGDHIANDLVLTSRVLRSPLVVLLNDGQDHVTVAVSPSQFASGEERASGGRQGYRASALVSPAFRLPGLGNGRALMSAGSRERLLVSGATLLIQRATYGCDAGRAPPPRLT